MIIKHLHTPYSLTYLCKRKNGPTEQNRGIIELSDGTIVANILLLGDNFLSASSNTLILNSRIDYLISTQRFDDSILTHD